MFLIVHLVVSILVLVREALAHVDTDRPNCHSLEVQWFEAFLLSEQTNGIEESVAPSLHSHILINWVSSHVIQYFRCHRYDAMIICMSVKAEFLVTGIYYLSGLDYLSGHRTSSEWFCSNILQECHSSSCILSPYRGGGKVFCPIY